MLNQKQKDLLRKINIYDYTFRENAKGQPIDGLRKILIPSWSSLHSSAYEAIRDAGFSTIERVRTEEKANCIIRLFQKRHYIYSLNCPPIILNLWGISCFTKNAENKWTTNTELSVKDYSDFEINFSKHTIIKYLWYDYISIDVDFFDIYVIVS